MGEWEMDTENVLSNHDLKVEGLKGNREEVLLGRGIQAVHQDLWDGKNVGEDRMPGRCDERANERQS